MLTKRIIPCLDIKDGRTVKGIRFKGLRDAGDPVELGQRYAKEGADELVFLDISASLEKRETLRSLVDRISKAIDIPFTVGGGIRSVQDARVLLRAGADKITINSAALKHPELITELSEAFGAQCVVVAIDARNTSDGWEVYALGGTQPTGRNLFEWALQAQSLGAGEILFTSMNQDGTKDGYANDALKEMSELLHIPVIASGGAGKLEHFATALNTGKADAVLAASVFHFEQIGIQELKTYLQQQDIAIRP